MSRWLFIILALSIATHFAFFGYPNQTVFDEVHFGKFISGYYTHEYFFDIHPPGGKILIAGFAKLFNFKPEFNFAKIGETFPDNKYLALRFLPSLAGTLLPIVIYLLALELGFSSFSAFSAGILVALENALTAQSRFILLDSLLLSSGFAALLFYFRYRRTGSWANLVWMSILGAFAASIKWTGLTFLALPFLIETRSCLINRSYERFMRQFVFLILIPFSIYYSFFAIHFSLLDHSGPGDAFMSPAFQKTLAGSEYSGKNVAAENAWQKFVELNKEMYLSNQHLAASHPYGSPWYSWPFMARPIFYWVDSTSSPQVSSRIYLFGNPVIWWTSTIAVLYLLLSNLKLKIKNSGFFNNKTLIFLMGGYFLNLLPFVGIKRVMFLYHYLTGLIFDILILVYLIDKRASSKKILLALIILAAVVFIFFSPLTYGLPLSSAAYQQRLWLPSWK